MADPTRVEKRLLADGVLPTTDTVLGRLGVWTADGTSLFTIWDN